MRPLFLTSITCVVSWAVGPLHAGDEESLQEKTQKLLVGKWTDPTRPGNTWEFDKAGRFTAAIRAGQIRSHPTGTYRVLKDGSLEIQVRVGDQAAPPRRFQVRVTKERLTFISPKGEQESYQRAK